MFFLLKFMINGSISCCILWHLLLCWGEPEPPYEYGWLLSSPLQRPWIVLQTFTWHLLSADWQTPYLENIIQARKQCIALLLRVVLLSWGAIIIYIKVENCKKSNPPNSMIGLHLQYLWMISYKPREDWSECGATANLHECSLSETLIENN